MRLFWRILVAFGGLLLLLIIAVAIAVRTIDVNDFIAPIQKRVKDATGRDLLIRGGIDFKLSLEPELLIDDVSLSNSEWGKAAQMVTAKRVEAQVKLLPLLQRRFEIVRFKLIDPVISLETNASGKGNWEFSEAAPDAAAPAGGSNKFAIGDLAIDHGTASYRDGESGKTTDIVIDELSLHSRDAQSSVSARFRGSIDDIAVAMEGDLGPLQVLAQRRLPYPVSLKGEVNGQAASVAAKMRIEGRSVSLDDLQISTGQSRVDGAFALTPGAPRSKATFKLASTALAWKDLPFVHPLATAPKGAIGHEKFLFSDQKLDLGALMAVDADGDLSIATLLLPDGRKLSNVHIQFTLRGGKFDAPVLQASALGGSAQGRLSIDTSHGQDPALNIRLDAKDIDLVSLLPMFGITREVRGGKTAINLDLATHGASPHEWASGASGTAIVTTGRATLVHTSLDLDSPLNKLANAVNPFYKVDSSTELECAVIRLPLKDGIAQIDRSIALETAKFGASTVGTLDFRNETLDLAIKPQVRHGLRIDIPQVANLVRFEGPFRSPAVRVDAAGSATVAAKIGAAVASGGLSIVGESLLSAATGSGAAACQAALGSSAAATATSALAAPAPSAQTKPSSTSPPATPLGKALDRLIGR
jgi:AsmA family protein